MISIGMFEPPTISIIHQSAKKDIPTKQARLSKYAGRKTIGSVKMRMVTLGKKFNKANKGK